jgi:hypothetical protein
MRAYFSLLIHKSDLAFSVFNGKMVSKSKRLVK